MARASVSMGELMSGVTMQLVVTGVRRARLRLWLGLRIVRLGAWVTGCGLGVSLMPRE